MLKLVASAISIALISGCSILSSKESAHPSFESFITFESGNHVITDSQKDKLKPLIDELQQSETPLIIKLSGYTDTTGSVSYNTQLSIDRNHSVMNYLNSQDEGNRFVLYGMSELDSKCETDDKSCNRMVNIKVYK